MELDMTAVKEAEIKPISDIGDVIEIEPISFNVLMDKFKEYKELQEKIMYATKSGTEKLCQYYFNNNSNRNSSFIIPPDELNSLIIVWKQKLLEIENLFKKYSILPC